MSDAEHMMAQMPRYQSHKRVWALKIAAVDGHRITPADVGIAPVDCLPDLFLRHHPEPGDYLVEYEGGYRSFSPGQAFEDGYRPCNGLTFGDALDLLKAGKRVARTGWNGKGMWLSLTPGNPGLAAERFWSPPNRAFAEANGGTAPVLPSVTMKTATGEILIGWLASQSDMLAEDWCEVEG